MLWITATMETGEDQKLVVGNSIDDAVRKATQSSTTHFALDDLVLIRVALDYGHGRLEGTEEISRNTFAASLIPIDRFDQLGFDF